MKNNVYSVSQVNSYLKILLQEDVLLNKISIKGEISNFKEYSSGHLYFSLKDESSIINCVMFYQNTQELEFSPENGIEVICSGYISLYEKNGQYQLYVQEIKICGKGNLHLEFEKLKNKLDKLDLFNPKFKKEIPKNATSVAVITSLDGAVFHDILNVSSRRNPNVKIILIPISVQGEQAKFDIVTAIEEANKWGEVDTIILARGGGSIEDLWAFNEEDVAYAIFNSRIPIISAIGHEVDFTISDFVADFRASTPSVAAEIAISESEILKNSIAKIYLDMKNAIYSKLRKNKFKISYYINSGEFKNFENKLQVYKNDLESARNNISFNVNCKIKENKSILKISTENLENKSPMNILKKGYTLIYDENNFIINSKNSVKSGDILNLKFYDGSVKAKLVLEEKEFYE